MFLMLQILKLYKPMKSIYLSFFIFILLIPTTKANNGDTLTVRSHDKVDQTWYGNYDRMAGFPSIDKSFSKIYMTYKLGCPSSGCSD